MQLRKHSLLGFAEVTAFSVLYKYSILISN